MLLNEVTIRRLRDRRAVARYAGLTGAPDESGKRRREKGLAKAGNARVRCGMIELAWRWLIFQKESALTLWFKVRVEEGSAPTQDADRGARPQAPYRALAHGNNRGGAARCRNAPGGISPRGSEKR